MATFGLIAITLLCYVPTAFSVTLGPCKRTDIECLTKSLNKAHPIVISGIPSLGIDSSDPLYVDLIEGDLSILKYKYTNNTVIGYKDCTVKNTNFHLETLKFYYELDCPKMSISGDYEISGRLVVLPVEGKGTYEIITSRYLLRVDAEFKQFKGSDGKTYINFKSFTVKPEALGPVKFKFNNLFNGQKDLSDAVHKFAHDNWKEVTILYAEPVFTKQLQIVNSNYNKFLKLIPLEDIFIA